MSLLPGQEEIDELANILKADKAKAVEKHKKFIEKLGKTYAGVSKNNNTKHRTANCYSCKEKLDSEMDDECNTCHWIICKCGACGCGYDSKISKDRPDNIRKGKVDENGIWSP